MLKILISNLQREGKFFITLFVYITLVVVFLFAFINPVFLFFILPIFYLRLRRMIGKQRLSFTRNTISLGIFILLLSILFIKSSSNSFYIGVAGCILGCVLGYISGNTTKFETIENEIFHSNSIYIPSIILSLFAIRIFYKIYSTYRIETTKVVGSINFLSDEINLALLGILFSYSLVYSFSILLKGVSILKQKNMQ